MRIEGTVTAPDGRAVPGVIVYAYHTDAHGIYPKGGAALGGAARRHGRLRGWVVTDEQGHYRLDTIRPASYPDNATPAHVHMHVIEAGRCTYYIDSIHFEDDPRLSEREREELVAGRGGSGLVQPRRDSDGKWIVSRDIHLGEGVPGYPAWPEDAATAAGGDGARPLDPGQVDESFLVTEPVWSPDGTRIAFAGGVWPDLDVFVLDARTGDAFRLFRSEATDYMPSWSPDSKRLVFASTREGNHDLYVGPIDGGQVVRLVGNGDDASDETEPRWSPDGKWIAFRSDRHGNREVHRARPDGTDEQRLTDHEAEDGEPSWSPDSRRLLFTSSRDGQPEVYVMAADGSDPVRLTETPGGHSRRAEWSPDGMWIAFGSNREGDEELYVMRPGGSDVRNVSRHPASEYYSRWSPDGQSLLFTSNRDRDKYAVYRTTLDGTAVERIFPVAFPGQDDAQALKAYVASHFRDGEPGGVVLVARGERPLLRSAYGLADVEGRRAMTTDQPLPIGSVTKSFTAGAILSLVRSGKLALGDDVRQHVPEAPVGERLVTIEQLLTHTSGMPNLVDVPGFLEWAREPRGTTELLARTEGVPFHFEPGTGFAYSDTGYILLGAVLERYHPGTWSDAVRDLVAQPLGLASVASAERLLRESAAVGYAYDGPEFAPARPIDWSVPHASGSLVATVDDLFRWVRAWRSGAVATPELSELAWAARTLPDGTRSGYGFGWQRCDFEGRTAIQHGGWVPGFTASVLHLPDEDLTAIALLNSTDNVEASYFARRALRLLLTGSAELSLQALTAEERASLVGRYRTASGAIWTVIAEENGLVLDLAGRRVSLVALSPTRLCAAESDGTWCFTFELGPDGRASSLAVSLSCEPQGGARREE